MLIAKCINGHIFDPYEHSVCPECQTSDFHVSVQRNPFWQHHRQTMGVMINKEIRKEEIEKRKFVSVDPISLDLSSFLPPIDPSQIMICPNCGKEFPSGEYFCEECERILVKKE